jgi:hypothetical protein
MWYHDTSTPKAVDGVVSAYLAKYAQIADPEVARFGQLSPTRLSRRKMPKFHMKKAKASGPDQARPRVKLVIPGIFTPPGVPFRGFKGGYYDRHSTSERRARRY